MAKKKKKSQKTYKTLNICNVPFILKHVPVWIKNYIFTLHPEKGINTLLEKANEIHSINNKELFKDNSVEFLVPRKKLINSKKFWTPNCTLLIITL